MMRQRYLAIALIGAATVLSGCSGLDRPIASNRDRGFDAKDLANYRPPSMSILMVATFG